MKHLLKIPVVKQAFIMLSVNQSVNWSIAILKSTV